MSLAATSMGVVAIWSTVAVSEVLSPMEMEPELSDSENMAYVIIKCSHRSQPWTLTARRSYGGSLLSR